MPIIVTENSAAKTYAPHPEGTFAAVCVDALDLGWKVGPFGEKYRVGLVFYCGEDGTTDEGDKYPLTAASFFNASFNELSTLRKFVESWQGGGFKLPNNDIEKLIGAPAMISVQHREHNGKTYANIKSVMPVPKGMTAPNAPEGFIRMCDREDWAGPSPRSNTPMAATAPEGDRLPWED